MVKVYRHRNVCTACHLNGQAKILIRTVLIQCRSPWDHQNEGSAHLLGRLDKALGHHQICCYKSSQCIPAFFRVRKQRLHCYQRH